MRQTSHTRKYQMELFSGKRRSTLTIQDVADVFTEAGWSCHKTNETSFSISCYWAEMLLEAGDPIRLYGVVDYPDDVEKEPSVDILLMNANIGYYSEEYDLRGALIGVTNNESNRKLSGQVKENPLKALEAFKDFVEKGGNLEQMRDMFLGPLNRKEPES